MDMIRPDWPVGNASCLEAMEFLTMNPTLERRVSVDDFPYQKIVKSTQCSWRQTSSANGTSRRTVIYLYGLVRVL